MNVQQAHLKLSEECHVSTDTVFLTASTHVSHRPALLCFYGSRRLLCDRKHTAYTSLSEFVFMRLFVFFSFKCFCHQLLFFFSLRNFVLTEHLVEAGGGGEECETDEERL